MLIIIKLKNQTNKGGLGMGDWGLGIGDWGLGPIPNPQSPFYILLMNQNFIKNNKKLI